MVRRGDILVVDAAAGGGMRVGDAVCGGLLCAEGGALGVRTRGPQAEATRRTKVRTINVDPVPSLLKIEAYWEVASMKHSSFPIFTRRYPMQGVENFAFDILLGKPCLGGIHHHFRQNGSGAWAEQEDSGYVPGTRRESTTHGEFTVPGQHSGATLPHRDA